MRRVVSVLLLVALNARAQAPDDEWEPPPNLQPAPAPPAPEELPPPPRYDREPLSGPLIPRAELEAKLAELELRREPIAATRSRAFALRLTAGAGYALTLGAIIWGIAAFAQQTSSSRPEPLSGVPARQTPIAPGWLFGAALLLLAATVTVHVVSQALVNGAEEDELALDELERPVRRRLSWDRDKPPD